MQLKRMLTVIAWAMMSLVSQIVQGQQPRYRVQALGSLGGTGCCFVITNNDKGWVNGTSNIAGDGSFHPFLWRSGIMKDLGTLGGPNASVGGMNDAGDVTVGGADTTTADPLGEDWCGFGTFLICRSYIWHDGQRTLVPTLGGDNGDVSTITNSGLVLGFAETPVHDPTCIAPQVLGFQAFLWDPDKKSMQVLPPEPGDTVTAGFHVNQFGVAVGTSGICGGGLVISSALHAVIWRNAVPLDLGNLGGAYGNLANFINDHGDVVGQSDLVGDTAFHGFLWTESYGLQDLSTLPGDTLSIANSINDQGQIAMQSCDENFNCRAAVWERGVIADLNTIVSGDTSLYLLFASSINAGGQIVGGAYNARTGAIVPFLATPCVGTCGGGTTTINRPQLVLPEEVREQLRLRSGRSRNGKVAKAGALLHEPADIFSSGMSSSCKSLGAFCTTSSQCCAGSLCGPRHSCCDRPLPGQYCNSSAECCMGICMGHRCE